MFNINGYFTLKYLSTYESWVIVNSTSRPTSIFGITTILMQSQALNNNTIVGLTNLPIKAGTYTF